MKNEEKIVKMNLDDEISAAGAAGKMDNGALLHDDIT
jgi:predicted solute-binding protein